MQRISAMDRAHVHLAERVGIFFAVVEAFLLAFVAMLHFGFEWRLGGVVFAAPFLYPAAIMDALLALVLLLCVLLPVRGGGGRAGRVLLGQILVVIGVVVGRIALMRGASLTTLRNEIFYVVVLVLALTSMVLVASPMYRGRRLARYDRLAATASQRCSIEP